MSKLFSNLKRMGMCSKILLSFGVILVVPCIMVFYYHSEIQFLPAFLFPAGLCVVISLLLEGWNSRINDINTNNRQQATIAVVSLWLFIFIIGGLPFLIAGQLPLLEAVFESVSGWTATGFTTMAVEETPRIFLFYRSFMQFTGGFGFVLLVLLFASGADAMRLFSAEGHPDTVKPNLIGTARYMTGIYVGVTAVGIILYILFGMTPFDAVNHAMAAMATGGFSTHSESIGYYNSIPIEGVTIGLMLVGGTNFAILALLIKRQFKKFSKIGELRFLGVLLSVSVPALTFLAAGGVYNSLGKSLRTAVFHIVSAVTSTGFSLHTFEAWPSGMLMILIILMLIGGGTGSTAGGMKYSRVYVLYKTFVFKLMGKFKAEHLVSQPFIVKPQGKVRITEKYALQIHHFAVIYLWTYFLGVLLLCLFGAPLDQAFFDFASSLGTIGLSSGLTDSSAANGILTVQILGMILARLEIYIVYIFIAAGINKINVKVRGIK